MSGEMPCPTCGGSGTLAKRTEWWIVCASGLDSRRSLDYWGPYCSEADAKRSGMYRPDDGNTLVEVPL